jgi:putative transposase
LLAITVRRRLHVLLGREGHVVNHKKLFRLYREERLTVRRRGGRKRAIGTRAPMLIPLKPNERWSLDFVSDQLTDGRRFRILTIVDDCTRECLALVADTSLGGIRVVRKPDRLMVQRGKPRMIVSDNGSEFTSNAILGWADKANEPAPAKRGGGRMALHRPGQADAERFHRKLQWSPAR